MLTTERHGHPLPGDPRRCACNKSYKPGLALAPHRSSTGREGIFRGVPRGAGRPAVCVVGGGYGAWIRTAAARVAPQIRDRRWALALSASPGETGGPGDSDAASPREPARPWCPSSSFFMIMLIIIIIIIIIITSTIITVSVGARPGSRRGLRSRPSEE